MRTAVADTVHYMQLSVPVFKQMYKVVTKRNDTMLLSFLKKLKQFILDISVRGSLLLPVVVEKRELLLLVERTSERLYRFVVIQTDPFGGLRHHAVSPIETMPSLKYRTCMVLSNVPKKNALDDVFWLGLYNFAIHPQKGDIDKFYDVLIPFLTGKPLEASLVEAEESAAAAAVALDE